jgi:hypothetical protein
MLKIVWNDLMRRFPEFERPWIAYWPNEKPYKHTRRNTRQLSLPYDVYPQSYSRRSSCCAFRMAIVLGSFLMMHHFSLARFVGIGGTSLVPLQGSGLLFISNSNLR